MVFLYFIVCSGKISDGRDNLEDNIKEVKAVVKSIKSLVQWYVMPHPCTKQTSFPPFACYVLSR